MTSEKPFLTIGMATYEDFYGVRSTVQGIKLNHPEIKDDVEILVVDNNPGSEHSRDMIDFITKWSGSWRVRVIPYTEKRGTSPAREYVFEQANGTFVLCCDCHVDFPPGSLAKTIAFLKENHESQDLFSGPMLYDDLMTISTHFDLQWRSEMWGIWATCWVCPDCEHAFHASNKNQECEWRESAGGQLRSTCNCNNGLKALPVSRYSGHEQHLKSLGYVRGDDWTKPIETQAQGLGCFLTRKDAWLHFNPHCSAFGGEEGYIHTKYRQAGHKHFCLPWLLWNHRFYRPGGAKYPYDLESKVRNYILEFNELGLDLKSVFEHFVIHGNLSTTQWNELVRQPTKAITRQGRSEAGVVATLKQEEASTITANQVQRPPAVTTIDGVFQWLQSEPRDLDEHLLRLREIASQCKTIVEITKRRESSAAFVAARPSILISHQAENDQLLYDLHDMLGALIVKPEERTEWTLFPNSPHVTSLVVNSIKGHDKLQDRVDMLFIDSHHTADKVFEQLANLSPYVKKFIVLHDIVTYGNRGENNGPGLLRGLEKWMKMERGKEWFASHLDHNQHGLVVLSRLPELKPAVKIHLYPPGYGAGTELKKKFKRFGITETPGCACTAHANQMDAMGPAWCRENMDTILRWLEQEASRSGKPFVTFFAKRLVMSAIRAAEKNPQVRSDFALDG